MIASVGLAGWLHGPVLAATFGPLADGDVPGLIDAIEAANANGEADTILLATNGTYTLSSIADARIPFEIIREGNIGLPSISSAITIQGNGSVIERDASLFTDSNRCSSSLVRDTFRIIHVAGTGNLTLEEVTLQNGCAGDVENGTFIDENGGGIRINEGTLALIHSTVRGNTANDNGGGIRNDGGTVTLMHSTVSSNSLNRANREGGGIFNDGIFKSGTVNLTHSTVHGNTARTGSGIFNRDTVTLTHSRVSANSGGGGIFNDGGEMTLTHSTVIENLGRDQGGGIFNSGTVTLTNSTVSGNRVLEDGGGGIKNGGSLTVTNSTVSGNTSTFGGAGLMNRGTLTLTNSTVSNNTVELNGIPSGITRVAGMDNNGTLTLTNTIVADQAAGTDCRNSGTITSNDFNLDSDGTCHLDQPHDKSNGGANLGLLQVNAPGITATHALLEGSAAIEMGDCSGGTITNDQRGVSRPQGVACDIGAYELANLPACTDPDLNHDGAVNILDVAQVGSCVGQDPTANVQCQMSDINCDGTIDLTDVNFATRSARQSDF